jgi:bacterioferritin
MVLGGRSATLDRNSELLTACLKLPADSQDSKRMLEIDLKQEQETIKSYRERIRQAERSGEFALSEALRDIIKEEQDHEIDLKDALGLR